MSEKGNAPPVCAAPSHRRSTPSGHGGTTPPWRACRLSTRISPARRVALHLRDGQTRVTAPAPHSPPKLAPPSPHMRRSPSPSITAHGTGHIHRTAHAAAPGSHLRHMIPAAHHGRCIPLAPSVLGAHCSRAPQFESRDVPPDTAVAHTEARRSTHGSPRSESAGARLAPHLPQPPTAAYTPFSHPAFATAVARVSPHAFDSAHECSRDGRAAEYEHARPPRCAHTHPALAPALSRKFHAPSPALAVSALTAHTPASRESPHAFDSTMCAHTPPLHLPCRPARIRLYDVRTHPALAPALSRKLHAPSSALAVSALTAHTPACPHHPRARTYSTLRMNARVMGGQQNMSMHGRHDIRIHPALASALSRKRHAPPSAFAAQAFTAHA
ncbi:hypothetical protein C8R47DRAFT_1324290 [Mycena vitilis]|nr:hypothetical protein C8R47DRAFT_1324290 [Mycena vitilis]